MSWKQRIAAAGLGAALALVVQFEGKVNRAYLDPVGKPTICYGHTGPEVHLGMVATDEPCEQWAAADLLHAAAGVRGCIARPMSNVVLHAYAVFAYRSEEHTSELQSLMRISYAVFCLEEKNEAVDGT